MRFSHDAAHVQLFISFYAFLMSYSLYPSSINQACLFNVSLLCRTNRHSAIAKKDITSIVRLPRENELTVDILTMFFIA